MRVCSSCRPPPCGLFLGTRCPQAHSAGCYLVSELSGVLYVFSEGACCGVAVLTALIGEAAPATLLHSCHGIPQK